MKLLNEEEQNLFRYWKMCKQDMERSFSNENLTSGIGWGDGEESVKEMSRVG